MTLTPAYGRDYPSGKAAKAAWEEGKDFIVADIMSPWCSQLINKEDAKKAGISSVNIRYKRLTGVVVVKVK